MASLEIQAIHAFSEENYEDIGWLAKEKFASPALITDAIQADPSSKMIYVGDKNDPTIVSKNPLIILEIWENPLHPGDPSYMVGLYSEIRPNGEGRAEKHPQEWLLGPKASLFVSYKMSCCTGFSSLITAIYGDKRQTFILDDQRYTHEGQKRYFEGKILLDTPDDGSAYEPEKSRLGHVYMHRTGQEHDCTHHHDYSSTTGAAPAPKVR